MTPVALLAMSMHGTELCRNQNEGIGAMRIQHNVLSVLIRFEVLFVPKRELVMSKTHQLFITV